MFTSLRLRRLIYSWFGCWMIVLLTACSSGTSSTGPTPQSSRPVSPKVSGSATSLPIQTPTVTVGPLPVTPTGCPSQGTARAAVMPPLALGSHATVVYVYNQGQEAHPIAGMLKRYDTTTRSETVIVTVPHSFISEAQVSADGQWMLFSTSVSNRSAIELVRMDGQGLQTLYCSASGEQGGFGALQWSPDQKYVAFREGWNVFLLTVATGAYQLEVSSSKNQGYVPRTWLDNTHLYLTVLDIGTETPPLKNLSLLDIDTAKVQQVLASPTLCGDFDSSIDGTQLFTSACTLAIPTMEGPSSITVQPATGGPVKTIYSTPSYAITMLRVASRTTLLFVIHNTGIGSIDSSHDGLWKVNIDGSGLTRLTSEAIDEETVFNTFTQYIWSTVSRDGGTYAVKVIKTRSSSRITSLLFGSLNGGAPLTFASLTSTNGTVEIAGWTTM